MYLFESHTFENLYKSILLENEVLPKDSFDMKDVDSSMINKVGYDSESETLQIEYNSTALYQYFDVPKSVFDDLFSKESIGKYAHKNIRFNYEFVKI